MTEQITVPPDQARDLMDEPITVVMEMDQPYPKQVPASFTAMQDVKWNLEYIDHNIVWFVDAERPNTHTTSHLPAPVGSTIEVEERVEYHHANRRGWFRPVCIARVTDVQVMTARYAEYSMADDFVAVTTLEREE